MSTSPQKKTLPYMVRDITFFYVKHFYNKELQNKNVQKLEEKDVINLVNTMYHEKETELKEYIKNTLKETLGEEYPKLKVNMLLLEMFDNPDLAKKRVITEIIEYQNNL